MKNCYIFIAILVFFALSSCLCTEKYVLAQTNQASLELQTASTDATQAFKTVSEAENAGANVTGILAQLNVAEGDLAQAENLYRIGDSKGAETQAANAIPIAQAVTDAAKHAKEAALASSNNNFWYTMVFAVTSIFVLISILQIVWRHLKRTYPKNSLYLKNELNKQ